MVILDPFLLVNWSYIFKACFIPINLTMFGWSYCFSILPSWRNFFFCSSGKVTLQVLTATLKVSYGLLFDFRLALYTSPKFPRPIYTWKIIDKYYKLILKFPWNWIISNGEFLFWIFFVKLISQKIYIPCQPTGHHHCSTPNLLGQ